jgi:hypothetical protein
MCEFEETSRKVWVWVWTFTIQARAVAGSSTASACTARVALKPVASTQTLYLALQVFSEMRLLAG